MKWVSGVSSYWQTRPPISGCVLEPGKPSGGVLAGDGRDTGVRKALELVGVDLDGAAVGRDLHPEPAELAVAVEGRVVLAEPRGPGPVAADAEEEDVAAREPELEEPREELRQPRAARPDDDVCPRWVVGRGAAGRDVERAGERAGGRSGVEDPRLGLEQDRPEVVAADGGIQASRLGRGQALAGDPEPGESRLAAGGEVVGRGREPRDADGLEEPLARLALEVAPELERAARRQRVPVLVAVREAQQARVTSRAGADVAGRVLLDEGHVPAATVELAGGRGAEDARADDDGGAHDSIGVTVSASTSGRW